MTKNSEERLREILTKILLIEESKVNDELSRRDLESWDSLAHLMLINEVENYFNITLSDDDIIAINTVGDLKRILRKNGVNIQGGLF